MENDYKRRRSNFGDQAYQGYQTVILMQIFYKSHIFI